nr:uncharacterized protein si:dkey-30e9.6 isoform X1 [Misgurnus anguillicaudatus]
MNFSKHLDTATSVDTSKKMPYSVSQNLISSRSYGYIPPKPAVCPDPWSIKAPDFTPKLYRSMGLPQINGKNIQLVKSKDNLEDKPIFKEKIDILSTSMFPELEQKRCKAKPFITRYKPPDSLESKLLFVRAGKYPLGPYKDPKPHNFRPCAEGKPDIITTLEKDPGSLIFKSQYLRTVTESQPELNISQRDKMSRMDTFRPADLQWDPRLILPKMPWPPKSASYTRHRRRRGAYSALMDRIEEKLNNSWRK